jgi:cystathionine beta-lyase/cystathionine gamma-synthase
MKSEMKQGTRAHWAGEEKHFSGATQVPVVLGAAFGYSDMEEWLNVATGKAEGHIYTRNSNPAVAVFEEKARRLENAEAATSAASGMGIISSTLFALLASGDRIVSVKDTYGGTSTIFNEYMPKSRSCYRPPADERIRRYSDLHLERKQPRSGRAADPSSPLCACGRKSRGGENHRRPAGNQQSHGMHR